MKNKLTVSLIAFLLLIPFRLPISILFIRFFEWIVEATTKEEIPQSTLATNVILSKVVYNLALSIFFLYNIEMFSREKLGRNARIKNYKDDYKDEVCFWWIVPIGILLLAFIIIDAVSVQSIFFS